MTLIHHRNINNLNIYDEGAAAQANSFAVKFRGPCVGPVNVTNVYAEKMKSVIFMDSGADNSDYVWAHNTGSYYDDSLLKVDEIVGKGCLNIVWDYINGGSSTFSQDMWLTHLYADDRDLLESYVTSSKNHVGRISVGIDQHSTDALAKETSVVKNPGNNIVFWLYGADRGLTSLTTTGVCTQNRLQQAGYAGIKVNNSNVSIDFPPGIGLTFQVMVYGTVTITGVPGVSVDNLGLVINDGDILEILSYNSTKYQMRRAGRFKD